ncbi:MAG: DNA translocase FtsK [Christensenellaceae bacterium]|nr:DNA translocase FtsK [Christensenellaceae bacterium]
MKREITGVLFIALGVFFAAGFYVDAVGVVGRVATQISFGVVGALTYVLPLLLLLFGILCISASSKVPTSTIVLCSIGAVCLLILLHANARSSIDDVRAFAYYKDAYQFGSIYQKGGGVLGALLAYPSLVFLGLVGTNIFFIAALLVLFLIITQISLRTAGEKVGQTVKAGAEIVAERIDVAKAERVDVTAPDLYTELMQGGQAAGRGSLRTTPRSGQTKPRRTPRAAQRTKADPQESGALDELSFFPSSGELPLKQDIDNDPFDILSGVDLGVQTPQPVEITEEEKPPLKPGRAARRAPAELTIEAPPKPFADPLAYQRPPFSLLKKAEYSRTSSNESPVAKGKQLVEALASFNISVRITNITVGPVITRFELQPAQGVRVNRITTLSDDIALALAAPRVRIEAPIPGKAAIGIEIPNKDVQPVLLRETIESAEFAAAKSPLSFALGKDIAGKVVCADLDKMPHLLIAGSTGSGKSVCINDIILSLVYHSAPHALRMILVDPKKVELKVYSPLPHLLLPVVTDAKKAAGALKWAVMEMEQRYQKMSKFNARDLNRFNSLQSDMAEQLPRLVIIIDELADLMMVAAKDVEDAICRIAQLGRAAGIHLIVATQRPSTDIITGLIKANIPSRIALTVSSAVDSRVIMDCGGAEKLLGRGDMLFHANGANKPIRAQAAFVSDEEVERVMGFFEAHNVEPVEQYAEVTLESIEIAGENGGMAQGNGKQEDDLLPDAVKIVLESGQASISMIQRRLRVGYARAARLIDIMEQKKIVSGFDGSKPRRLLITAADYAEMFGPGTAGEAEEE